MDSSSTVVKLAVAVADGGILLVAGTTGILRAVSGIATSSAIG